VFVALVVAVSVMMSALIARPIRALSGAAARIGRGDLQSPVEGTSRDEIGFLAATMDEMRRELRARDERMQLMLSGIAHEVRNPLGGIELFSGILRDELPADAPARGHVARIERELAYLKAVVEEFLEYARRAEPQPERIELAAFCAELLELVSSEAAAGGVTLSCEVAGSVVSADRQQLKRALLNLVRNAVQAAAGGTAGVRARAEAERTIIEVYNSGAPIPPDVRERIFEPFFTTKEKGTGLGLAFARDIVRDHGGAIEVTSDEGGTVFRLSLPRG